MAERLTYYVGTEEAAAILGVHPSTVIRRAKSGAIPVAYTVEAGGRVLAYRFERTVISDPPTHARPEAAAAGSGAGDE